MGIPSRNAAPVGAPAARRGGLNQQPLQEMKPLDGRPCVHGRDRECLRHHRRKQTLQGDAIERHRIKIKLIRDLLVGRHRRQRQRVAAASLAVIRLGLTIRPAGCSVAVTARFPGGSRDIAVCVAASASAGVCVRSLILSGSRAGGSTATEQLKMPVGANTACRHPTAEYGQRNHCQNQANPRNVAKALHENLRDQQELCERSSQCFPSEAYRPNG